MKRFFILIFLLALGDALPAAAAPRPAGKFRLLPQPRQVAWLPGKGLPSAGALRQLSLFGGAQRPLLRGLLQQLPASGTGGRGSLVLQLSRDRQLPDSPEAYRLEIKNGQATVTANGQAGLFYGCQTLSQLLEDAREQNIPVPACRISDHPDLAYRAVHLDLKHHLDAAHYYYDLIDRLAAVKVNALIVEFEDKLRYRQAPLVGAANAMSVEEFAALSRYAADRHIEISPLVQGLGHASFILKHDPYKKLRDDPASDWAFDPLHPETYKLQFSLYEDAIAATPGGRFLHVGGDEVGELGKSARAVQSGKKPFELQMYWLNKVSEFARQHNRVPIFWDDMLFKLAGVYQTTHDESMPAAQVEAIWKKQEQQLNESIHLFPKNCVYMRWNYWDPTIPGNLKAIDWFKAHGLQVMAATAAQQKWPMMPRENSNSRSIGLFSRVAAEKKMDGILCTVWDDSSPHFETTWRGLYRFAASSWNAAEQSLDQANALFRHRFYGAALSDSTFEFQNELEKALAFWETALLEKGHRHSYPDSIHLITLPLQDKPGAWNSRYQQKVAAAKTEAARYARIRERIEKGKRQASRNLYSLELMAALNELQVYPARLLLALSTYDAAAGQDRKVEGQKLRDLVSSFAETRRRFEKVFSQTRFLSNAEGYLLDQNGHHHLANGTNNSDWMYVYELAMNKKIAGWNGIR
ncbi:MAG: glycoside hydrolase family 20 zincin-like fold domain-containing protein [Adhaeribacter sp.]